MLCAGGGRGVGNVVGLSARLAMVVLWAVGNVGSGKNGGGGVIGGITGTEVEVGVGGSSSSMTTVLVRDGVDTL